MIFQALLPSTAFTAAKDMMTIQFPATLPNRYYAEILEVDVSVVSGTADDQIPFSLHLASTLGTGSAMTVTALDGATDFTTGMGGLAAYNLSADSTKTATLYRKGVTARDGFSWKVDKYPLIVRPGKTFAVRLDGNPAGSTTFTGIVVFSVV